jgi:ABC-type cobalamin transport system ATPase subunit
MLKDGETQEVMTSGNLCKLYNMDIKIADFEGKRNIVYV